MIMSLVGHRSKNDCVGNVQQQFTRPVVLRSEREFNKTVRQTLGLEVAK
jgi:hypothetical protein